MLEKDILNKVSYPMPTYLMDSASSDRRGGILPLEKIVSYTLNHPEKSFFDYLGLFVVKVSDDENTLDCLITKGPFAGYLMYIADFPSGFMGISHRSLDALIDRDSEYALRVNPEEYKKLTSKDSAKARQLGMNASSISDLKLKKALLYLAIPLLSESDEKLALDAVNENEFEDFDFATMILKTLCRIGTNESIPLIEKYDALFPDLHWLVEKAVKAIKSRNGYPVEISRNKLLCNSMGNYPSGKFKYGSFNKPTELVIGSNKIISTEVECYSNGNIRESNLCKNLQLNVGDMEFEFGRSLSPSQHMLFYPDGAIRKGTVGIDCDLNCGMNEFTAVKRQEIYFHNNGCIRSVALKSSVEVSAGGRIYKARGGSLNRSDVYYRLKFFDNGSLNMFYLETPAKVPVNQQEVEVYLDIAFYPDGKVYKLQLADDTELETIIGPMLFKKGRSLILDSQGKVKGIELNISSDEPDTKNWKCGNTIYNVNTLDIFISIEDWVEKKISHPVWWNPFDYFKMNFQLHEDTGFEEYHMSPIDNKTIKLRSPYPIEFKWDNYFYHVIPHQWVSFSENNEVIGGILL